MYAWMLCVFTVIMAYSITCPIIVPFGKFSSEHCGSQMGHVGSLEGPALHSYSYSNVDNP